MKKKLISLLLVLTMLVPTTPVLAEETQTVVGEDNNTVTQPEIEVTATKGSTFVVSLPKSVALQEESDNFIKAGVYADIDYYQKLVVEPTVTTDFKLVDNTSEEELSLEVIKLKTEFKYDDEVLCDTVDGILLEENLVDICKIPVSELPTGNWKGELPIRISLVEDDSLFVVAVEVASSNDLNAKAFNITGDTKDTLLNELVSSGLISSVDEIDSLIDVKCDDFTDVADVTFNVQGIAQPGESIVVYHYDETNSVWEYIDTVVVGDDYFITCSFNSLSPVGFKNIGHEHRYFDGSCSCGEVQGSGLYDIKGRLVCTWEESDIDIERDLAGTGDSMNTSSTSYILNNVYPQVTEIIMPEGIKHIGDYQMYACNSVRRVTLSSSIESVGICGIINNANLEYLCLGTGITSLGDSALGGNVKLKDVVNFDKMKISTLPECVFAGNASLESILLPSRLKSIDSLAFNACRSLKSIVIPSSVTSIGVQAFYNCSALTDVVIYGSITTIAMRTFMGCVSLERVVLPNTLTTIGTEAFVGCTGFRNLTIPSTVTSIGNYAFENVPHITYNGTATGAPWGALSMNAIVATIEETETETSTDEVSTEDVSSETETISSEDVTTEVSAETEIESEEAITIETSTEEIELSTEEDSTEEAEAETEVIIVETSTEAIVEETETEETEA